MKMKGKFGIVTMMIAVLVGIVIGAQVLTVLFASDGPFSVLTTVASGSGNSLGSNAYQSIIAAMVALIPLAVVGAAAMYFWNLYSGKRGGGRRRGRRGGGRRRRGGGRRTAFARRAPVVAAPVAPRVVGVR